MSSSLIRARRRVLQALPLLLLCGSLQAQSFTSLAAIPPSQRGDHAAAVGKNSLGNKRIHVMGGRFGLSATADHRAFDPNNQTWFTRAPLPVANYNMAFASGSPGPGQQRLYLFGGQPAGASSPSARVDAYDPASDVWDPVGSLAPMPTARFEAAATRALDGRIFVFGGAGGGGLNPLQILDTVEVYDPADDSWATLPSMPSTRTDLAAVTTCDGRLFVIGGDEGDDTECATATIHSYDPITGVWDTSHPDMPTALKSLAAATGRDGRIYVMGGIGSGPLPITPFVAAYDPDLRVWDTNLPQLPSPRMNLAAVAFYDTVYVLGGEPPKGIYPVVTDSNMALASLPQLSSCKGVVASYPGGKFLGNIGTISVSSGGIQNLLCLPGVPYKGKQIIVVGSISGTEPGLTLGELVLPLNPDFYFWLSLNNPEPILSGSVGTVADDGTYSASFSIPSDSPAAWAGITVNHSYAVRDPGDGTIVMVGQPVSVTLVP